MLKMPRNSYRFCKLLKIFFGGTLALLIKKTKQDDERKELHGCTRHIEAAGRLRAAGRFQTDPSKIGASTA